MTRKVIGHAAVDSGQLLLVDPCYLGEWRHGEYGDGEGHYDRACRVTTDSDDSGGEVLVAGVGGRGVAFSTGWGDGCYPVEAEYEGGRVKSVTVRFF